MSDTAIRSTPSRRRFASPAVRAALRRRLAEAFGLVLALAGLALLLALLSHDPGDPSLSTATWRAPANLVGGAGALLSDLLLQALGWAALLPGIALLVWAWRLAATGGFGPLPARLAALLAAMPLLAAALALSPLPEAAPTLAGPGGVAGPLLRDAARAAAEAFGAFGQLVAEAGLIGFAAVFALLGLGLGGPPGEARPTNPARRPSPARLRAAWDRVLRPFVALTRRAPPAAPGADLAAVLEAADAAAERAPPPPPARATDAPAPRIASQAAPRRAEAPRQAALDLRDGPFQLPPLALLGEPPARRHGRPSEEALAGNARMLEQVLEDYGVRGRIVEIRPGPVVTLYELEPAPGTKSARVIGLADDIARTMSVVAVRIAVIPGRNVIGIELPNARRETVHLSEMFGSEDWVRAPGRLPLALGKDIGGGPVIADLARMPHLLIAGTTGSGKSVAINTMILSLLYRFAPDECRFIMIDPKMLELSVYDRIPHLLAPVVTEPPKAIVALKWTVREMERRYRSMSQLGVRNIAGFNERVEAAAAKGEVLTRRVQTGFDPETGRPVFEEQPLALSALPMIVVVIDEMADLMIVAGKEIEAAVQRLAQMARAAGIHVIMATQRPSVDVITGTIKANFPTRISFQVTSKIDSRTILGEQGAEQLLGQGDMLFMAGGGRITRVHGPFVSDQEVERVADMLRAQGEPSYVEEVTEADPDALTPAEEMGLALGGIEAASDGEKGLFDKAVQLVSIEGKASTSFIQRHLQIGYNRAAKLIEQMEREGVVSAANHVGKREVLVRRTEGD